MSILYRDGKTCENWLYLNKIQEITVRKLYVAECLEEKTQQIVE